MSLAIIHSRACKGITAPLVTVETHISNGLPSFSIVGLPETAVKESKDRVRSALLNSRFEFPTRRITVNLAPADLPKEGGRFDLPIALGILVATAQLPAAAVQDYEFAGELALSGLLRPVQGILPFALATAQLKRKLMVPQANAEEATVVTQAEVYATEHLLAVCAHLTGQQRLAPCQYTPSSSALIKSYPDLNEVIGQARAKRALEIAAAGGHSLLLIGPPGTGKTMLASRLPGILPILSDAEAIEVAAISSITGQNFKLSNWRQRPFRAPHHTASSVALVGGGSPPRPGEISLAHHGVLFLDELPEFNQRVLEALREPLEARTITISRAAYQAEFPANFQLIAAMNPCPCGHLGHPQRACRCTSEQIMRYRNRLSGPLLDRIDMQVEVPSLGSELLASHGREAESSASVRDRVEQARALQMQRSGKTNANLSNKELSQVAVLTAENEALLQQAVLKLGLSARLYHRFLRVARTIADLTNSATIMAEHLAEALTYRSLDFKQV